MPGTTIPEAKAARKCLNIIRLSDLKVRKKSMMSRQIRIKEIVSSDEVRKRVESSKLEVESCVLVYTAMGTSGADIIAYTLIRVGLLTAVVNSCAAMADITEMTIVSIKGGKKN